MYFGSGGKRKESNKKVRILLRDWLRGLRKSEEGINKKEEKRNKRFKEK